MPLNKLENFIKNTEGRILYVNPNDLDATDSISNSGNSLTKPFKTIQRALIESARFSYRRGLNNDRNDQTTILLFPGEHLVDNRPGYGILNQGGAARARRPTDGALTDATTEFDLNLTSNFDLTQSGNILYKFNSIHGGVIVPRGTSIVGLDLRKTKIRPKYIPNPTDDDEKSSAIFRITGNCYFWQFSLFDADELGLVYTNSRDFTDTAKPTFSHHKLTCFEYADGVNIDANTGLTDLDMYYAKLSNAYNTGSIDKDIDQKWPSDPQGFAKERPEFEIVGAFASDPIAITNIFSGDGGTPTSVVTVETTVEHNLTVDTPIKIDGVGVVGQLSNDYNISSKVQSVPNTTTFTYVIPSIDPLLPASPTFTNATVTVETDTVKGSSPYIFNCSLRSVWGMNGMHADGSKATGFRSMVVAQFTGVSLQKDDRAFTKYNKTSRTYDSIPISPVTGPDLSTDSSSKNPETVYHLDSGAIYRSGWESTHIKVSNDSFIQIVSVFAIGFNKHFVAESGGDNSITNSNSNFGQISLVADGFKNAAFAKDDHAYVSSIITPRAIVTREQNIDWFPIDVGVTTSVGISSHLYLSGFNSSDDIPPVITQGYRIGARTNDKLYVNFSSISGYGISEANIYMLDNVIQSGITTALGTTSSAKDILISGVPTAANNFTFTTSTAHNLNTEEKVKIISEIGDIPEGLIDHTTYFVIKISNTQFQLSASETNARNGNFIRCYLGSQLRVRSRVSDKSAGEVGSPIQFDSLRNKWYIHTDTNNQIYNTLETLGVAGIGNDTKVSFVKRIEDTRSLDEKIYKVRVVIPKEAVNAKNPEDAFIIQESNSTNISITPTDAEFSLPIINTSQYDYKRNPRFISTCSVSGSSPNEIVTVISEFPHNLKQGNRVVIENVKCSNNTTGLDNLGYNGTFEVNSIIDDKTFTYSVTDIFDLYHNPGNFQNDTAIRNISLPRFRRNDLKTNYYIYRNEVISQYIEGVQDGIYHIYALKADKSIDTEFTSLKHSQNVVNLYPELDRDNPNDNPQTAFSFSKRDPIGDVVTNDLKRSVTREALDTFIDDFGFALQINNVQRDNVSGIATLTFERPHSFSGIVSCTISDSGSTYTPAVGIQTYQNVKIFNNDLLTTWNGATARVVVNAGIVTSVDIISKGSAYSAGTYYLDDNVLGKGGGTQATLSVASNQISSQIGNVIQTTGIGSVSDGYFRITTIPSKTQVSVAFTSGDSTIIPGEYAFHIGPSIVVNSATYLSSTGIITINCASPHGLVAGNRFRIVNNSNDNLGDYIVADRIGVNTFTALTNSNLSLSSGRILKHGLSANEAVSESGNESLAVRSVTFFADEIATLAEPITGENTFKISTVGIATAKRFSLGDYIQIDDEIMRITSSEVSALNEINVIRGYFGTLKSNHDENSLIRKVKPLPIEFRRPSIIRASGHTFEYLGFGPGNYSTGLPQVQERTLTEREDFLGQSQERSCGTVVYTGMNNRGDFYIGNKRVTSATGEEKTFDAPVPTVTGEDPLRLSAVFDEITVKERLKVEGGKSKTILSQFDGPVTFNNNIKVINSNLEVIGGRLTINDETESTSADTGSVVIDGGVGIAKNVNIGGSMFFPDDKKLYFGDDNDFSVSHIADFSSQLDGAGNPITPSSATVIEDAGPGPIVFKSDGGGGNGAFQFFDNNWNPKLKVFAGNSDGVTLYHGNKGEKLTTISTGCSITGELRVSDDITAFYSSDERLKDNVTAIDDPLAKVLSLGGYTFDWNENTTKEGSETGVIAQEVEALGLPGLITTRDNGYKAVRYEKLVPLLIEAIKELSNKVESLERKVQDK